LTINALYDRLWVEWFGQLLPLESFHPRYKSLSNGAHTLSSFSSRTFWTGSSCSGAILWELLDFWYFY